MPKLLTPLLLMAVAVLAIAFFIRGGQLMYAVQSVNSSWATTNITNSAPYEEGWSCSDDYTGSVDTTVDLNGGSYKIVTCNSTVTDFNGANDFNGTSIASAFAFFGPATSWTSCIIGGSPNFVNCVLNTSCAWLLPIKNVTSQYLECKFALWFNANNTTAGSEYWNATHYQIIDLGGLTSNTGVYDTIEMAPLLAIGVDSVLAFGVKSAGVNDTNVGSGCGSNPNCKVNVTNYGNIKFDVMVNGSAMTCVGGSGGTIQPYSLKYSLTDNSAFTSGTSLTATMTDSLATLTTFNLLPNQTTSIRSDPPTAPGKPTWWGIGVPPGVNGNCQGIVWFTAVDSPD